MCEKDTMNQMDTVEHEIEEKEHDDELQELIDSFDEIASLDITPKKKKFIKRIEAAAYKAVELIKENDEITEKGVYSVAAELKGKDVKKLKKDKHFDDLCFSEIALLSAEKVKEYDGSEDDMMSAALSILTGRYHNPNKGKKLSKYQMNAVAGAVASKAVARHDITTVVLTESKHDSSNSLMIVESHTENSIVASTSFGQRIFDFCTPMKGMKVALRSKKLRKNTAENKRIKYAVSLIVETTRYGSEGVNRDLIDRVATELHGASDYDKMIIEMALLTAAKVKELGGDEAKINSAASSVLTCKYFKGTKESIVDIIAKQIISEGNSSLEIKENDTSSTVGNSQEEISKKDSQEEIPEENLTEFLDKTLNSDSINDEEEQCEDRQDDNLLNSEGAKCDKRKHRERNDDVEQETNSDEIDANHDSGDNKIMIIASDIKKSYHEKRKELNTNNSKKMNYMLKVQSGASLIVKYVNKQQEDGTNDIVNAVIYVVTGYNSSKCVTERNSDENYDRDRTFVEMAVQAARHVKSLGGDHFAMEATAISILSCRGLKRYKTVVLNDLLVTSLAERAARKAMNAFYDKNLKSPQKASSTNVFSTANYHDEINEVRTTDSIGSNTLLEQGYLTNDANDRGCCVDLDNDDNDKGSLVGALIQDISRKMSRICHDEESYQSSFSVKTDHYSTTSYDI